MFLHCCISIHLLTGVNCGDKKTRPACQLSPGRLLASILDQLLIQYSYSSATTDLIKDSLISTGQINLNDDKGKTSNFAINLNEWRPTRSVEMS